MMQKLLRVGSSTLFLVALATVTFVPTTAHCQYAPGSALQPVEEPAADVAPMATPRPVPDGRFHVQLRDGSLLVGKIGGADPVNLKSVLGAVEVPVKKIHSIHFESPQLARVSFRNGDTLSGELQATALTLETSFGEVKVKPGSIVAVISHEQFVQNGMVAQRIFRKTKDGEVVQWKTYASNSGYGSAAAYNGTSGSGYTSGPVIGAPVPVAAPGPGVVPATAIGPAYRPSAAVPPRPARSRP